MPCFASTAITISAALLLTLGSISATVSPAQATAALELPEIA
jgi:hypothetical protein